MSSLQSARPSSGMTRGSHTSRIARMPVTLTLARMDTQQISDLFMIFNVSGDGSMSKQEFVYCWNGWIKKVQLNFYWIHLQNFGRKQKLKVCIGHCKSELIFALMRKSLFCGKVFDREVNLSISFPFKNRQQPKNMTPCADENSLHSFFL